MIATSQNVDSFDPNAAGGDEILAMAVQTDGKIIVGGNFTNIDAMTRSNLVRLNNDGSLDVPFDPEPNGEIRQIAVQTDGKILVGGTFTAMGGTTRNSIARLNSDGSLDTNFNSEVAGPVYGLLVQGDRKIMVWGEITQIAGQPRTRIGRLNANGSLDTSFDPGFGANDSVYTVALQPDGKYIVGGANFTSLAGQACRGIARLNANGSFDNSFQLYAGPFADYRIVYSLVLQPDGKILVSGADRPGGFAFYNYIRRLKADGSLDTSFAAPTPDALITTIALQSDGKILIGGVRIARLNASGSLDASFNPPGADSYVYALNIQADGKILAGGSFTMLAGQPRRHVGRLTNTGAVQQSFGVNPKGTAITWQRSGPGPELHQVTFEQSPDGTNYVLLGNCTNSFGGWQLAGITVPAVQRFYLRARGQAAGGYFDSSSGLIEQVAQIYYVPPPIIFQDNGAFQYTFNAGSNKTLVVFATTNLSLPSSDWTSLGPPAYLGDGYYQYADLGATNFLQRFYRVVEP